MEPFETVETGRKEDEIKDFVERLARHALFKAEQHDGVNAILSVDTCLIYLMEETGEVADAVVRKRFELAMAECLDVAHMAMLSYFALNKIAHIGV
jgi:hypothetical protein